MDAQIARSRAVPSRHPSVRKCPPSRTAICTRRKRRARETGHASEPNAARFWPEPGQCANRYLRASIAMGLLGAPGEGVLQALILGVVLVEGGVLLGGASFYCVIAVPSCGPVAYYSEDVGCGT